MTTSSVDFSFMQRFPGFTREVGQGFMVSLVVAVAAQFLAEHYGSPAMLMALLIGMAFNFLGEEGKCVAGIEFSAKTVLRFGVAMLGIRISVEMLIGLGAEMIALVVIGVIGTIAVGLVGARLLGRGWRLALLTGGSVAICGASAAMAIAAILPRNEHSERNLSFTVLSVTVLSTLAMIVYPVISQLFELNDLTNGVFLGGTIHDVAQVVGAGFSVSEETGETATMVKLIRVAMLAPVVLVFSVVIRNFAEADPKEGKRPPLIPGFIFVFLILAAINSAGVIPGFVSDSINSLSRWALLIAISAVGMKTSLARMLDVPGQAIVLIVAETLFIGAFILAGIRYLS